MRHACRAFVTSRPRQMSTMGWSSPTKRGGRCRSSGRILYRSGPSSALTRRERRGAVDSELESAKLAVADFSWQKYQILCCIASSTNIRSTTLVATITCNAACATCSMRSREPCRNRRRTYSACIGGTLLFGRGRRARSALDGERDAHATADAKAGQTLARIAPDHFM